MLPSLLLAVQLLSIGTNSFSFAPPIPRRGQHHLRKAVPVYRGPEGDPLDMVASLEVEELGLVLEVGGSTVAPGTLGLFARLASGVDKVEWPAMTLLGGYARGNFCADSTGDKTVAFALGSAEAAVFFERELMTVEDALLAVAERAAAKEMPLALAGHEVSLSAETATSDDDKEHDVNSESSSSSSSGSSLSGKDIGISSSMGRTLTSTDEAGVSSQSRLEVSPTRESLYPRYFVPDAPEEIKVSESSHHHHHAVEEDGISGADVSAAEGSSMLVPLVGATNLGTWCNDRAFESGADLGDENDYRARAMEKNCVQLVWRLAWDEEASMLVPTWPVSVLSQDVCFENCVPMELGSTYGWEYWQATVELAE